MYGNTHGLGDATEILTTRLGNYVLIATVQHRGVHMKKAIIAVLVIAGFAFSARPASAQACVGGIIFAAFYASMTENRELSAKEAATCGLLYGADRDKAVRGSSPTGPKAAAKAPPKKPAKTAAAKTKPQ